ncbi:AAA family ATPase [Mycoplasma todarodis]|uniref:Uncharacterized protein n=1 Tax=Mycoplasma todarodis TaxID=1937191 RepID=A0A4R0XNF6_9MOLU|nr:AAA family ATPase [Mycoplasma todarodis]TCG12102.1 hypothetical protein C4B25_00205 [Mycoplasma todarodis]
MYLRKLKFKGIKGACESLSIDLTPKTRKLFNSNVEYFNLQENKNDFGALKQAALIGLNASGKTTILLGATLGFQLLTDPINAYSHALKHHLNAFNKEALSWEYEYVCQNKTTGNVYKYFIEFEWSAGIFQKEKITVTEASKKNVKQPFVLYELKDLGKIEIKGKEYTHQPSTSLFSLVKFGQVTPQIKDVLEEHINLFYDLNFIFNYGPEFSNLPSAGIFAPPKNKLGETYIKILKTFDPMIKNVETNPMGVPEFILKSPKCSGVSELRVSAEQLPSYLSKGTMSFITMGHQIMDSIFREKPTTFGFDELDASMHTGLFKFVFELMRYSNSQYIFTTHSSDIFKLNLRDDQIIQVQKNEDGDISTSRVSDMEFNTNEKTETNLKKNFLSKLDKEKLFEIFGIMDEFK